MGKQKNKNNLFLFEIREGNKLLFATHAKTKELAFKEFRTLMRNTWILSNKDVLTIVNMDEK